jgi:transposase
VSNVLNEEKKKQVVALGQLGWALRRIEAATGVRRETAAGYLKAAGIPIRAPGGWGRRKAKPANEVTTGAEPAKPANGSEVTTGSHAPEAEPTSATTSISEPYRELIEAGLSKSRNAMSIWQDLVDRHGFTGAYESIKAKVENAVLLVERWILAALRHHRFVALGELNDAIAVLLERLNNRPFRKREGTRASLFAAIDQPMLQPLPGQPYITADWKTVRASIDYHVEVDRHFYSVPYQLAGQQMEARFTSHTVEIFESGKRVASHMRSFAPYLHTTTKEHMPKSHQAHMEWTPSRLIHWAETVGEATALVIATVLATKRHPEIGYRACLGIMRLGKTYSNERLEAASKRALELDACSPGKFDCGPPKGLWELRSPPLRAPKLIQLPLKLNDLLRNRCRVLLLHLQSPFRDWLTLPDQPYFNHASSPKTHGERD